MRVLIQPVRTDAEFKPHCTLTCEIDFHCGGGFSAEM